jgi:hypothetical protein
MEQNSIGKQLEKYTAKHPQEVLIVKIELEQELDEIAIFKGKSCSLMRPTAFDPDVPVLPEDAKISSIDRIMSPYNPEAPQYIQQGISWQIMEVLLSEVE